MRPWSLSSLLRLRCPSCGADSFRAGLYRTAKACAACGQRFERESGFYAGAIYPFYGGSVAVGGLALLAATLGLGLSFEAGLGVAAAAVLLASPWLFWYSRLSFLHTDHRFFGGEG
jgi:uncharacterized protein (DUF983 family)